MNYLLVLIPLFLLVITPAFGALSDKTGLKDDYKVDAGGYTFEVETTANYEINDFNFNKDSKKITLQIESSLEDNLGEVIIQIGRAHV